MRNLLIFGSGRSGTSLAAGSLADAGYHQGDRLLDGDEANPKGYFEDRGVNDLNEDILDPLLVGQPLGRFTRFLFPTLLSYGRRWIADLPPEAEIPRPPDVEDRLKRFLTKTPFCYKDPRFSYTLPVWRPHLPPDTGFVVVFRHPLVTAKSIVKETDRVYPDLAFDTERALSVWSSIHRNILEKHVPEGGDWLFLHFDQFFDGSAFERLAAFSGAKPDEDFVDQELRRTEAQENVTLPREVEEVYRRLCRAANPESPPMDVQSEAT